MKSAASLLLAVGLAGCSGPYDDLAKDFAAKGEPQGQRTSVSAMTLVSNRHEGAFNYNGVITVSLAANTVEIRPISPASFFLGGLDLPAERISGCSMTCFGVDDQHADLLFESHGAEISFDGAAEFIDWCWRNDLPLISGANRRDWLYAGGSLSGKAAYLPVPRDEYERQALQACRGF
jgi:hypothetical protein